VTPRYLADPRHGTRRLPLVLAWIALALPAAGCAAFWDEALSRERDLGGYFRPPDPLVVIRDSTDGERRAKALASLREPTNDKDHEVYVQILTTAARTERDPLCRLGAISALGYFKDPRAAATVKEIFTSKLAYTAEFNSMIRQTALRSLEKIGSDDSRELMILVARSPGPAQNATSRDSQQTQDEKLIAIRALGKYRQPECIDTLVYILETEKDAALRERANQSLQTATGKHLPAEAQAWRAALAGQPVNPAQPNVVERVTGWFKQ
jgi:hypothetical protein